MTEMEIENRTGRSHRVRHQRISTRTENSLTESSQEREIGRGTRQNLRQAGCLEPETRLGDTI